jgi:hypothetical protein
LLDALGWDRPQTTEIGVDISYSTAVVEVPGDAPAEWKLVLTLPDPPHVAVHSVLIPTENRRWIIAIARGSAFGPYTDRKPPLDHRDRRP